MIHAILPQLPIMDVSSTIGDYLDWTFLGKKCNCGIGMGIKGLGRIDIVMSDEWKEIRREELAMRSSSTVLSGSGRGREPCFCVTSSTVAASTCLQLCMNICANSRSNRRTLLHSKHSKLLVA